MCVECPHVATMAIPIIGMVLGWIRSWRKSQVKPTVYEVFGSWGKV